MSNVIDSVGDNKIILEDGTELSYTLLSAILTELADTNLLRTLVRNRTVEGVSAALIAGAEAVLAYDKSKPVTNVTSFGFVPQDDNTIALVAETADGQKFKGAMNVEQVDTLRDYADRMVKRYPGKTRIGVDWNPPVE